MVKQNGFGLGALFQQIWQPHSQGLAHRRRYLVDVKFVLLAITVVGRHKLNLHSESVALRPQFETWAVNREGWPNGCV
jgi:hypothetical protein